MFQGLIICLSIKKVMQVYKQILFLPKPYNNSRTSFCPLLNISIVVKYFLSKKFLSKWFQMLLYFFSTIIGELHKEPLSIGVTSQIPFFFIFPWRSSCRTSLGIKPPIAHFSCACRICLYLRDNRISHSFGG